MKIDTLQDIQTKILQGTVIVFESSEQDPETGRKGRSLKLVVRSIHVDKEKWKIEFEEAFNISANRLSKETSISILPAQFKLFSSNSNSHLFVRDVKSPREYCSEITINGLSLAVEAA